MEPMHCPSACALLVHTPDGNAVAAFIFATRRAKILRRGLEQDDYSETLRSEVPIDGCSEISQADDNSHYAPDFRAILSAPLSSS